MVLNKIKALLARKPKRSRTETIEPPEPPPAPTAARVDVHRGPEVVHHPVSLQDLDQDAVRIVTRLTRFDHKAYLVGGCVRDLLLERKPKDFDIGTSATPRQIKRLFSNCRIIGRRFRLAHIYFQDGKIIEVATFRSRDGADGGNGDGAAADGPDGAAPEAVGDDLLIRDDNVFGTPEEDALRRDFTINALFYDVNAETVIDHADGLGDLRRRLVRTIGDPVVRFREDPIRILRAIKFAARLDFAIEPTTLAALRVTRVEIPKAAPPRVLEEFNRFCRSGAGRRSFELCFATEVFEVILPELAATYGEGGGERRLLTALLDAIDARWNRGLDVGTGEIFAALMFAAVAPSLGWSIDGSPAKRDGRDARTIVDDALRPIALRLRIARKDQEHVRQALTILQRMVPLKPMRRGAKVALMRRPAFGDALGMLEALAPLLGGDFSAAGEAWAEAAAGLGAEPARAEEIAAPSGEPGRDDTGPTTGRRRRGRRGGRGRRRSRDGSIAAAEARAAGRRARGPFASGVGRQLLLRGAPLRPETPYRRPRERHRPVRRGDRGDQRAARGSRPRGDGGWRLRAAVSATAAPAPRRARPAEGRARRYVGGSRRHLRRRRAVSTWPLPAARVVIAAMAVAAACAFGCSSGGSGGSLGATFTASATPQAPRLVKLVQKSKSNTRVVVQAVIYGPDVTLDMYSFAFDVKIGDPSVVRYVAGSAVAGNALVPFAGQTIQAIADLGTAPGGGVDNSRVVVGVTKLGGGVGNGIAGTSAVVVELTFAVQKEGTTTLTLTGDPTPAVLNSNQPASVISSITFDSASATVKGVSTGGGGY